MIHILSRTSIRCLKSVLVTKKLIKLQRKACELFMIVALAIAAEESVAAGLINRLGKGAGGMVL